MRDGDENLEITGHDMSGPSDRDFLIDFTPAEGCRFAYTLNGKQPVRSTLIGEEPLFFLDNTETFEDEGLFDLSLLEDITKELGDLQKKVASYEAISEEFRRPEDHVKGLFASEAEELCVAKGEAPNMKKFISVLEESRVLKTFIQFADENGISLKWSTQAETADYDRNSNTILINPDLEESYRILLAASQLRQAWQHKKGVAVDPMAFYPDHGILINRLQAADLSLFMIRTAWELQLAGHKQAWELVENSALSDLGRAFAREVCNDFRTLNNGRAGLALIEAWFLSERCRKHDRNFIQRMLAGPVKGSFDRSEELSRQACLALISSLGETPYGQNYLSGYITTVMDDPIFYEVRDRSNANFLWFIKFENSFSDVEENIALRNTLGSESKNIETNVDNLGYNSSPDARVVAFPKAHRDISQVAHKKVSNGKGPEGTILPFGEL